MSIEQLIEELESELWPLEDAECFAADCDDIHQLRRLQAQADPLRERLAELYQATTNP